MMIKLKHIIPAVASLALVSCGIMKNTGGDEDAFVGKITYGMSVELPGEEDGGSMAQQIQAMLPSAIEVATNGVDFGMKMDGPQPMHMISKVDEGMMYTIAGGQYSKTAIDTSTNADAPALTVEELPETMEILGYTCKAYSVTQEGVEAASTLYVTDEINVVSTGGDNPITSGPPGFSDQVKGTALRMEQNISQMGMEMKIIVEAKAIEEGETATTQILTIPEGDYQEAEEAAE